LNKNTLFIIGLLVFAGLISWNSFFRQYSQRDTVNIHFFPKSIEGWTSREVPISDYDYKILETKNAFSRIYRSDQGEEVMLYIVYSQNNRKVSHPPEICYTGSGAAILNETQINFDLGPGRGQLRVVRFASEQRGNKLMTYYWYKVGNSFTPNYWKQQVLIAIKTLLGRPASSAMVRLSVGSGGSDTPRADGIVQDFTRVILSDLKQYLP